MLEIFGKLYIIDIDAITEICKTDRQIKNEDGTLAFEINIFKYELLKLCIERVLNEYEPNDEEIGAFAQGDVSISFKIAFNTLLKNNIIIEYDTDEQY